MSAMYLISFTCKVLLETIFFFNWCHCALIFAFDFRIFPKFKKAPRSNITCIFYSVVMTSLHLSFALVLMVGGIQEQQQKKDEKKRHLSKNLLLRN